MSAGSSIEFDLFAVGCAALDDRLRTVLDRLAALEARQAKLEPDDEGLTFMQAARLLGGQREDDRPMVDSRKIAVGGGPPCSPRILCADVHRVVQSSPNVSTPRSTGNASRHRQSSRELPDLEQARRMDHDTAVTDPLARRAAPNRRR